MHLTVSGLSSCRSRRVRTDSPGESLTRFQAILDAAMPIAAGIYNANQDRLPNQRSNDLLDSPEGWPVSRFSTLMSSSISGQ